MTIVQKNGSAKTFRAAPPTLPTFLSFCNSCVNMKSRPDKNHINGSINSDAVRGSEPGGTKTWLEKAWGNLAYRDCCICKSCLSIYFIKSKRTPRPPPRSWLRKIPRKYPERQRSHQLRVLCTLWLSVGEGRFLVFLFYGHSNFRAPSPPAPEKVIEEKGLGTRCKFNSIWPTGTRWVSDQKLYKKLG